MCVSAYIYRHTYTNFGVGVGGDHPSTVTTDQIRPKPNYIIMETYPIYRLSAFEVTHSFMFEPTELELTIINCLIILT